MPAISRRPWKTADIDPDPSVRTHSRLGTSASGRTRSDFTRPSIVTRSRHRTLAMGIGPSPAGWGADAGVAPTGAAGAATAAGLTTAWAARRDSKWIGTVVTLAWASLERSRSIASDVRSWRRRPQMPWYLRSG